MRPLLINQEVRDDVARLVAFAEAHPVDAARLERILRKEEPEAGNDPRHAILVPFEFRVVFSVDELPNRLARHLSMSIPQPGRLPSPEAVRELLPLFAMAAFERCAVWVEGTPHGLGAISVLCGDGRVSGEPGRFAPLRLGCSELAHGRSCAICRRPFCVGDSTGVLRAGSGMPGIEGGSSVALAVAHFDCLQPGRAGAVPREAAFHQSRWR